MSKIVKCTYCERVFQELDRFAAHLEKSHADMIPPDVSPRQYAYMLKTGRTHGNCVMCKAPTGWNEQTGKFHRFCDNPKCKEDYKKIFRQRMMDKHGKITMLDDPDQQRKMLMARRISGKYIWSDRAHVFGYTGTYEKEFLEFLDGVINLDPNDLMTPSPHNYFYVYEGKKHLYFPDMYIPSLNLEIEIKDGGDNPNNHPKIQAVDKVKEKLKDEVMSSKSNPFNYLKIVNKNHMRFFTYLEESKKRFMNDDDRKIVML